MYYLYFLIDPIDLLVKYIGVTKNRKTRLSQHIDRCKLWEKKSKKGKWIKGLLSKNNKPIMVTVNEYKSRHEAVHEESRLIRKYIKTLTNTILTNG